MKLDACIYCPGSQPKNRQQAKRLRDTRANRARELSLYRALTPKVNGAREAGLEVR